MQLEDDVTAEVTARLRRAHGQLAGVIRMLEEGRDCREIVAQAAAVRAAIDRANYRLMLGGIKQCVTTEDPEMSTEEMEKLFLKLA